MGLQPVLDLGGPLGVVVLLEALHRVPGVLERAGTGCGARVQGDCTIVVELGARARGEEPTVLPTKVPNLVINGSQGIAVGMATNIPPHNLGEVIDGVLALIADPKLTDDDLLKLVPGPDFPTGGVIQGRNGIIGAYKNGRGTIAVRGVAHVEEIRKDRQAIVVTELPYAVNKARW